MKKILGEEYYSLKETAEILGVSKQTVHDLIKSRKIEGKKIGRLWHFTRGDIKAYLDQKTPPGTKRKQEDIIKSISQKERKRGLN